ncbi:unnamed protein product [Acanthoscelides obtectus]|uniref:Uncharacterized protein n=1 Tax=Acanthoscelides obtectus TaxID=200917 RepID=A0A9P0P1I8_ACAOB|nr:unnamed protein product [Acanthoscelides obtectus]CAK1629085.1 hypothetical protein AOBTE_LOCUS5567 [Acanthoscelides obtectus]
MGASEAQDEERMREIDVHSVQDLIRDILRKLRLVEQNGPLQVTR